MPSFKNIANKFHKDKNGNPFWESRSVAVEIVVLALYKKEVYVLIEKRSNTMMDSPGKFCMPSGYIDYNESGWEAAIREVYEETGIYLPDYDHLLVTNNNKEPFKIAFRYCFNRKPSN